MSHHEFFFLLPTTNDFSTLLHLLVSCYCWLSSFAAERLLMTVPIEGQLLIPDGTPTTNYEVTLNGNLHSAFCRSDGLFTFHDVQTGVYLLDVSSVKETFPQMKLKVVAEEGSISVVEYKYPGAKKVAASYPIMLKAIAPIKYFQVKPPLSIMKMIMSNPMMLMMGVMLVVVLLMPKMMAGMDPEELKELQKQQAQAGDPMKQFQKLWSGGGKDDDDDE